VFFAEKHFVMGIIVCRRRTDGKKLV
jgi:hypothetical protein